jgi:sugar O-acyltransferase (sialic acid O-acetyltransferase NeuD family)
MSQPARSRKSNANRALIVGAGGHGRVVLDILLACQDEVIGFLDNNPALRGRRVDGVSVLGSVQDLETVWERAGATGVVIAIGDNGARLGIAREVDRLGITLLNAIHPSANLASSATIGRNVVICAGAVLCAHCQAGDSVILNTGCIIDYQTMIGEGVHICPGVRIAARAKIESGSFVGTGATIVPNVTIGYDAIVGAGAVVLEDIEPMSTVVGVPARPVKRISSAEELFEALRA